MTRAALDCPIPHRPVAAAAPTLAAIEARFLATYGSLATLTMARLAGTWTARAMVLGLTVAAGSGPSLEAALVALLWPEGVSA